MLVAVTVAVGDGVSVGGIISLYSWKVNGRKWDVVSVAAAINAHFVKSSFQKTNCALLMAFLVSPEGFASHQGWSDYFLDDMP